MIFLDTSYINGLLIKRDSYKHHSNRIKPLLQKESKATNLTVLVEVLNSLKPNNFNGNIKVIIHQLLHLDVFDCFTADDYRNALELYRFYGQSIYFSDCTILISVQKHGITKIASFDSDFDKIVGFERIF